MWVWTVALLLARFGSGEVPLMLAVLTNRSTWATPVMVMTPPWPNSRSWTVQTQQGIWPVSLMTAPLLLTWMFVMSLEESTSEMTTRTRRAVAEVGLRV